MAWVMAAAMCITTTACGSTASSTASSAAGTSESSSVEGAFKLGLICPLSGSSAISGQIMQNATKMAVDEINAAGGINGSIQINLVSVDDESVPATSVTAMQKLVEQDKVNAVIGTQASSCTLADMEITKAAKIPQITPASSNVAVTQSGNDYIYQLTATDELHMRNVMGYMVDEYGAKSFAILYESSAPAASRSPAPSATTLAWKWWTAKFTTPAIPTSRCRWARSSRLTRTSLSSGATIPRSP